MAKQSLPERPVAGEIKILFGLDHVASRCGEPGQFRRIIVEYGRAEIGFTQILQPARGGAAGEVTEIDRRVDRFEHVVRGIERRQFLKQLDLLIEKLPIVLAPIQVFCRQRAQEGHALANPLALIGDMSHVKQHGFPCHLALPPAGKGVVADVGDAVAVEVSAADLEDTVLNRRRHPGEHAVDHDIVERDDLVAQFHEIAGLQVDIGQRQFVGQGPGRLDLRRRQVDADEIAAGQPLGHGNEIAAGAAAEFQQPAAVRPCRRQAEQTGKRSNMIGMRMPPGQRDHRQRVVDRGDVRRVAVGGSMHLGTNT